MTEELAIIALTYDFLKYITPVSARFPRNQRYLLGERIEVLVFDILELFIEAKFIRDKKDKLNTANVKLEKLRFFVRLAFDLKLINVKRYGFISDQIQNIGKQLGGWIRSV